MHRFSADLSFARELDKTDPLRNLRDEFHLPGTNSTPSIYFCGNSLGLQPKRVAAALEQELRDWRELAVEGYTKAKNPWLYYQQQFNKPLGRMMGCLDHEVTVMNTLTMNLHLMLISFYHPGPERFKIIMEAGAFPSDQYAVETQVRWHGLDPAKAIIEISPRPGEKFLREGDILESIRAAGEKLALVLLGGIQYYSGQFFNIPAITAEAQKAGAIVGFDLAHAAGNVPLALHDWNVDFAVWCSYKYLNGGPGAVGGLFVHERHARNNQHMRLGGWWGNEEKTRFLMEKGFIPKPDASGWNISTAQVFNMVALKASLEVFGLTSMEALRKKSVALTAYLEFIIRQFPHSGAEIITPANPEQRGAQLSLFFPQRGREVFDRMLQAGIVVDYREPGVIRMAPAPLYNSFEEIFRVGQILAEI